MSLHNLAWPRRTSRLALRLPRPADVAQLWEWHQTPQLSWWMPNIVADRAEFRRRLLAGSSQPVVADHAGQPIALATFGRRAHQNLTKPHRVEDGGEAEIGWTVAVEHQGNGVASELAEALLEISFDEMGVRRVVAESFAENLASRRVMEKIGMRQEGYYRASTRHRQLGWRDTVSYAMLASEWQSEGSRSLV